MTNLSNITRRVARIVLPDMMVTGSATGGSTTTLADTVNLTYSDAYLDKGTIWMLSGSNINKVLRITGHRGNTLTFSETLAVAIASGNRYAAARSVYTYERIKQAVTQALDDTYVDDEDSTLDGDGVTLEFTLPAGVIDIKEVWIENPDDENQNYRSSHYKQKNGLLRFDYGYPPEDGWVIRIIHRVRHSELVDYDDEIDQLINEDWLCHKAAFYLLDWGMGTYKAQAEYRIEERMNFVLESLKTLKPRKDAPSIRLTTSDG